MKIIIIGGVAAGATAATNIRRKSEDAEIILLEKDRDTSFKNCEIPYFLSYMVEDSEDLIARKPEAFAKRNNIDARNYSEVISINRDEKKVTVLDHKNDRTYEETYDKLIIATGASPFVPDSIKGLENPRENVFKVENVVDVENIRDYIETKNVKNVLVNGAGFIGIEAAENLSALDKLNISLIVRSRVLSANIDEDLAGFVEENIKDHINLIKNDEIIEVLDDKVILKSGSTLPYDLLINAIGVKPNSSLAEKAGLSLTKSGAIDTDRNFLTNDPDIYAIGDVIEVYKPLLKAKGKLNLAWAAHRQAKFVGGHILGESGKTPSFIGSFALRSFDMNVASVGLSQKELEKAGIAYKSTVISHLSSVSILPYSKPMHLKISFDSYTGKIYGLQAVGEGDVVKRIDIGAALIGMGADIYDLYNTEISYQPIYSTPEDALNVLAAQAIDVFEGKVKSINISKLKDLDKDFEIYDLRNKDSFDKGHIKGSTNINPSTIREKLGEFDKNKKILLVDKNGASSKSIAKIMQNAGYNKVYILDGGFEFLEKYDKMTQEGLIVK